MHPRCDNPKVADAIPQSWLFVMKSDEARSWAANSGYEDSVGLYYSYDSNVARSSRVAIGDLIVVRHDDYIAGWGTVESIDVDPNATKDIRRCPRCQRTNWYARAKKVPALKCNGCDGEFEIEDLIHESMPVTAYRANYAGSWTEAVRPVSFRDPLLTTAQTTTDTFNAIRPLDPVRLTKLIEHISGQDFSQPLTSLELAGHILGGGHSLAIVRRRRGQREFRFKMMERFGERCAISGEQPAQVLEAAHLYSYAARPEHRSDGGLLLRRDHHALFDANLVTVNPTTWKVEIAPTLRRYETYAAVEGVELQLPRKMLPDRNLIESHYRTSLEMFDRAAG